MTTITTDTETAGATAPPNWKESVLRKRIGRTAFYALMILIAIVLFTPFILAFLGTFKSPSEIIAFPPKFFPSEWLFGNWPDLFSTDLGGVPRPEGATSLGLMAGMLVFFGALLGGGMSSAAGSKGVSRMVGLPVSVALAAVAGVLSGIYMGLGDAEPVRQLTVGIAIGAVALIGVGVLAMSKPDWRRVIIAMVIAIGLGAAATILFEVLAVAAGGGRFIRWIYNTALLSVVRAFLVLLFSSMAAYAFARLRWPGRNIIFAFMLASMMIPGAVTLIPAFFVIAKIGWINTGYSLVIPGMVGAFGIFLLTQFLKAIPVELEESALIDGASNFQIFGLIVLPLAKPALLTLFILQFQAMWNDFLTPLLYLNTPDMWVLNVALSVFQQQFSTQWNLILVGAMVNAAVPLSMFFFFSRYYIQGVSYAGLKG